MFIYVFTDIYFGCKKPLLFRELLGTRARQVPVAFRFSVGTVTCRAGSFVRVFLWSSKPAQDEGLSFSTKNPAVKSACSSGLFACIYLIL